MIDSVGVDAAREQQNDDLGATLAGGIRHRVLIETIDRVLVRPAREQGRYHLDLSVVGCRHQRRDAVHGGDVHVCSRGDHRARHRVVILLECDNKCCFAQTVARVGRSTVLERAADAGGVGVARRR